MDSLLTLSLLDCVRLLAARTVGRVAYSERALPAIRPVNYALVGRHIVLRTRRGGLASRLDGQVVAFEIDDIDPVLETGWSVVVTGTARVLRDPGELASLDAFPLVAWAGPEHDTAVWITPGDIQGRRVGAFVDVA